MAIGIIPELSLPAGTSVKPVAAAADKGDSLLIGRSNRSPGNRVPVRPLASCQIAGYPCGSNIQGQREFQASTPLFALPIHLHDAVAGHRHLLNITHQPVRIAGKDPGAVMHGLMASS
jgi:hypothetical protein